LALAENGRFSTLQQDKKCQTVQLFVTCHQSLYPGNGEAVVRVLQKAGVSVSFSPPELAADNQRSMPDYEGRHAGWLSRLSALSSHIQDQ
jgi:Fe-S oxidoreductase